MSTGGFVGESWRHARPIRVAVVDPSDGDAVAGLLEGEPFDVHVADEPLAVGADTDVVLVDPHAFGGSWVIEQVRKGLGAVVIAILASATDADRVAAFDAGAADVVTKPLLPGDLRSRVLLRATGSVRPAEPPLAVSPDGRSITAFGRPLMLTRREQSLLEFLLSRADTLVTRDEILDAIWGPGWPSASVVTEYIRRLRSELSRHGLAACIVTRHGFGYVLMTDPDGAAR